MANQRDKTKSPFTFYIDKNVKENVQKILSERGSTLTEYIIISIYKLIEKNDNETIKEIEMFKTLKERDTRTRIGKARISAQKNKKIKK